MVLRSYLGRGERSAAEHAALTANNDLRTAQGS